MRLTPDNSNMSACFNACKNNVAPSNDAASYRGNGNGMNLVMADMAERKARMTANPARDSDTASGYANPEVKRKVK